MCGCNSRIGCLEAALRLPKRCFQSLANDLHHALARGEHDQLRRILSRQGAADLAYLGLTPDAYQERLRAVAAQLNRRFVYWVSLDEDRGSGRTVWFKKGPLGAAEQQCEAGRLVAGAHGPEHLRIVLSREPDDGVDSPVPRGLVTHRHTPGAHDHLRAQQAAARSTANHQVRVPAEVQTVPTVKSETLCYHRMCDRAVLFTVPLYDPLLEHPFTASPQGDRRAISASASCSIPTTVP
jgi:hypothetical protein